MTAQLTHVQIGQALGWSPQLVELAAPNAPPPTAPRRSAAAYAIRAVQVYRTASAQEQQAMRNYYLNRGPGMIMSNAFTNPPGGTEQELLSHMYRQRNHYNMPRCKSCTLNHRAMPGVNATATQVAAPVGTEQVRLFGCGCFYVHAMMEEYMFEKNFFRDRRMSGGLECFSTTQDRSAACLLFENIFGPWTFDKMCDRQQRVAAATSQLNNAGRNCGIFRT